MRGAGVELALRRGAWRAAPRRPSARPTRRGAARGRRGSLPSRRNAGTSGIVYLAPVSSAISSSSSGRSAPMITPVTPGGTMPPASHCCADARRGADQRALQQRLVGHGRDRLVAAAGEEQLLDARGVSAKPALGHRLDVVVVRCAAHAADVHGAVAGACRRAQPCTSSVILTVSPLKTSKSSRPSARRRAGAKPASSAAATSGSSVPRGGEAHRQPAVAQLGARARCCADRPTPARSGCRTAGAGST